VSESDILLRGLEAAGLAAWRDPLEPLLRERFADNAHGDIGRWRAAIDALPVIGDANVRLDSAAVSIDSPSIAGKCGDAIRDSLLQLRPWRKGPFNIHGVDLDAEWRSDLKWHRLANEIESLDGRRVLDVGCGNGYYAFRMIGAGARSVIGIDPMLLFVFQFLALNHFFAVPDIQVLPLRLNELPGPDRLFDTTFSMGVLYHQREPLEHLSRLRETLRPGGELVLETLIYPGDDLFVHQPEERYARMRNVWHLPTAAALAEWLRESGFRDVRLVDVTTTTTDEQRTTEWMPFESLREALDPNDPSRTLEGLPAPARALVTCKSP
jgi:tRNA (mo5U34)-methyltransferase